MPRAQLPVTITILLLPVKRPFSLWIRNRRWASRAPRILPRHYSYSSKRVARTFCSGCRCGGSPKSRRSLRRKRRKRCWPLRARRSRSWSSRATTFASQVRHAPAPVRSFPRESLGSRKCTRTSLVQPHLLSSRFMVLSEHACPLSLKVDQ